MDVQERRYADVLVLVLSGKINHNGADAFREALLPFVEAEEPGYQSIVLDLAGVEYMSSVGLRALMLAAKKSKTIGRTVVVAGLNDTMQEIFQISRFNLVFDIHADVPAALAELSADALDAYSD